MIAVLNYQANAYAEEVVKRGVCHVHAFSNVLQLVFWFFFCVRRHTWHAGVGIKIVQNEERVPHLLK